ncbi:MAG: GIY-YIG nuclease family protein [Bacteroidales bacterium]|nr:GIY-YIG nuclease family protein [Bacteroidales bacterium]
MKDYLFFVYVMATDNNRVIYVGVTNDLKRRVFEHRNGINKGFTSRYNVSKLVYYETFHYINAAIAREKKLKEWRRVWKDDLINRINPQWNDLSTTL